MFPFNRFPVVTIQFIAEISYMVLDLFPFKVVINKIKSQMRLSISKYSSDTFTGDRIQGNKVSKVYRKLHVY